MVKVLGPVVGLAFDEGIKFRTVLVRGGDVLGGLVLDGLVLGGLVLGGLVLGGLVLGGLVLGELVLGRGGVLRLVALRFPLF
jgi:hypothetical protein